MPRRLSPPRPPAASYRFPRGFTWGVAAAASQIEGAAREGDKGESIWDRFAAQPGRTLHGDTPAVACDHYHRFEVDFALMQKLGIRHYRLSLCWPRLHPDGGANVNQPGIDFYRRAFDTMARHGITPWVTLYHWDLPQALEDQGGWRVRSTVDAFERYCRTAVRAFGDLVKHWFTLNEIPTFVGKGYRDGDHAPGAQESASVINQILHHAILAHGRAVAVVRECGGRGAKVGLSQDINPAPIPVTETPENIAAARQKLVEANAAVLAPIFHGAYPDSYLRRCGRDRPRWARGDLECIAQPNDFLGLNVYTGHFVEAGKRGRPVVVPFPARYPTTTVPWLLVAPQSVYWALRLVHEIYQPPSLLISENGAGHEDTGNQADEMGDLHRREYVRNHLLNVHRAVDERIPCRGYFLWSFMDNFEWAAGYSQRFGIVHVDYATRRRTPKLSARWYAEVIRQNRLV